MGSNYVQKNYTVTRQTLKEIEAAMSILDTDNQSYALRRLASIGLEALKKSKEQTA